MIIISLGFASAEEHSVREGESLFLPTAKSVLPFVGSGMWHTKDVRPHKGLLFLLCGLKMVNNFIKPCGYK